MTLDYASATIDATAGGALLLPTPLAGTVGTTAALRIEAVGPYDSTSGVLSVDRMVVVLND